jgi:serine/threonine protein kinase
VRNAAAADAGTLVGEIVEERYQVEVQLGAGAMGAVYRGRHIKVGRPVAIKVLHDHLVQDTAMLDRFEREALIAARLHHDNLVSVIDLGVTPRGQRCMILELAPGRCLAELVDAPMPRERVIDLTRQLLCGLEHAHALGLVHRDLKPENILVEQQPDGRWTPRIVDFGIAVLRDGDGNEATEPAAERRRLTTAGMVLGTPMYMSPEQARGEAVDHRADLFALGVIVYQLLAGKPPFEGTGVEVMVQNIVHDPPSIATRAAVDVDPRLEAFARTLMAREANDRFQSAAAALTALEAIARSPLADDACVRARDAEVTRRHVVATAMAPLAKPAPTSHSAMIGAVAILAIALALVVVLAAYVGA